MSVILAYLFFLVTAARFVVGEEDVGGHGALGLAGGFARVLALALVLLRAPVLLLLLHGQDLGRVLLDPFCEFLLVPCLPGSTTRSAPEQELEQEAPRNGVVIDQRLQPWRLYRACGSCRPMTVDCGRGRVAVGSRA